MNKIIFKNKPDCGQECKEVNRQLALIQFFHHSSNESLREDFDCVLLEPQKWMLDEPS